MSLHYEVVLACALRDDLPDDVIAALRWHLGERPEPPPGLDPHVHAYPLLEPDPYSGLPGGDVAALRPGDHHGWGLFTRNLWLDDDLGMLTGLLDLIAPHAEHDGYAGHFRATDDAGPTVLVFRDGGHALHES
ncbi:hypothetical protein [Streptomyces genisteinicus]|uniref:Uncharacterized protein n=1 Tax=Streptomyces genisteinicus TaxID=2768068 RepID=A0A7H0HZX9_9ACTN|nr:hypothetical protein [Streptomyces genisteinicus]QNP66095.1 hypothetical protein IAG43_26330 [Streptomyces genisteinicus]